MTEDSTAKLTTTNHRPPSVGRFLAIENSGVAEDSGLGHLTVVSPALKGRGDITYWIPPQAQQYSDLPVVVLLHGVYGSHWAWADQARAHQTAHRLIAEHKMKPCILAMPSDGLAGEGSGFINTPNEGPQYENWIADDVPDAMRHAVAQIGNGSRFYLAGLSMGGFGAMRIGARRGDRFAAFSGMSSLTHLRQMSWCTHQADLFLDLPDHTACLLHSLLENNSYGPFRFDCGFDDYLIEENRKLHAVLLKNGIDHQYQEYPGEHNWDYWREHLADTLQFFHHVNESIPKKSQNMK